MIPNLGTTADLECAGFLFFSNFDSGNLARVEWVPKNESAVVTVNKNGKDVPEVPDLEFNIWTKPDCMGTEFENGNRTWFYFGIKGFLPAVLLKINLVDLNRQAKMYSQGMAPVYRTVPGRAHWERIRDRPTYSVDDNVFTLSFKFRTPENIDTIIFFAFTYPYTYSELQTSLLSIDQRFLSRPAAASCDDIYYHRELLCKSLEKRRIDLITISSYYNIFNERETRLRNLFSDTSTNRPYKFHNKKVIFISARVHPGETPSSFVFNGLLNFLLNREDPLAIILRRMYVFKMIPFLNPDGVVRGHYRTDTRGVNLNRMYLSPKIEEHPSVYAARALLQYYHYGFEKDQGHVKTTSAIDTCKDKTGDVLTSEEKKDLIKRTSEPWCSKTATKEKMNEPVNNEIQPCSSSEDLTTDQKFESGLFLYLDMHGHASKKGIFMYGNHFDGIEDNVECMLLPKIMSLNNHNFHFNACNFTERNMYLKDKRDGMSREGSGRVAVLKLTGLIRSYTLECNYNSGRMVNVLPPTVKEVSNKVHTLPLPPKYTPHIFEEAGRSLGISILDLTGNNPNSRIPNSEFHSLSGLREWLRSNAFNEFGLTRLPKHRQAHANQNNINKPARCKSMKNITSKSRPTTSSKPTGGKKVVSKSSAPIPVEKKENMLFPSKDPPPTSSTAGLANRSFNRITNNRSKGILVRPRSKRDLTRSKSKESPKIKTNRAVQTTASVCDNSQIDSSTTPELSPAGKESPKRIKVIDNTSNCNLNSDRIKLREICFIKGNMTKTLIAKFNSESSSNELHDDDDDLVVAWDPNYSPKVISRHDRPQSSKFFRKQIEPSTSKQTNKPNSFVSLKAKRSKGNLRRLASANLESSGKIDKMKKRKKLKSKIL